MNWLKKERDKVAKKRPVLKDIRALYHDGIGISIKELRLIENDPHYLAKPVKYANIIHYFQNERLLDQVCNICPINKTSQKIENNPKQKKAKVSMYNKDIAKLSEITKLVIKKKRENYIFQNARYRYSLKSNRYMTIEHISMTTTIPIKKMRKMEKSNYLIDDFDEADILLRTYFDPKLSRKICGICPVSHAATTVIKGKNIKEET